MTTRKPQFTLTMRQRLDLAKLIETHTDLTRNQLVELAQAQIADGINYDHVRYMASELGVTIKRERPRRGPVSDTAVLAAAVIGLYRELGVEPPADLQELAGGAA